MVDDKSVAISMINKGNRNICITLSEFTLYRIASDRGDKHAFVQYDEET